MIEVELFGIPRLRAGKANLTIPAGRVGDVLAEIVRVCPKLPDLRSESGRPGAGYLLSLDGERFLGDPDEWLPSGTRLLVLSADAGG